MTNSFTHGYVLLIGVGECVYSEWSLPVTVKDMQALQSLLRDSNLCGYLQDENHIRLLQDADATGSGILQGLYWLQKQAAADEEATVVVYYSGHGWWEESTGKYYLIPHDINPFDIPNSALSAEAFTEALQQIPAQRLLVIIDSCHAAGMTTAKDKQAGIKLPPGLVQKSLPEKVIAQLKQGKGRAVFSSSRGEEQSWVRPDKTMSIYTYHLMEALQGVGNHSGETVVKLSQLMHYLGKTVPQSAQQLCQAQQTPFFDMASEDFAVALLRGGKGLPADAKEAVAAEAAENIAKVVAGGDAITNSGNQSVTQPGSRTINIGQARDVQISDRS
ncbi:MAG: caspase family protein [Symploca sp. SIO3E6]|nr:caspase family protein [Caldora sp. SIO3E6]